METKCERCGSTNVVFYKQTIADGRIVITARCERGHIPQSKKPFYPLYNFHLERLAFLPKEAEQLSLFDGVK